MKSVKRNNVVWESYHDGVLVRSGVYKTRTIYIDKFGNEWFNYISQKRKLENGKIVYRATTIKSSSFDDIIARAKQAYQARENNKEELLRAVLSFDQKAFDSVITKINKETEVP